MVDETEYVDIFQDHTESRSCTGKEGRSNYQVCLRNLDHSEISTTDVLFTRITSLPYYF